MSFYVRSNLISSFKSLRAGSQGFALLMLFLCMILHTMWSGKNLQLLCCACLPSVNILLAVYMLEGMVV